MLLELLTGRRPGDRSSYGQDGLVDWVSKPEHADRAAASECGG
jgi:hypothetical protein